MANMISSWLSGVLCAANPRGPQGHVSLMPVLCRRLRPLTRTCAVIAQPWFASISSISIRVCRFAQLAGTLPAELCIVKTAFMCLRSILSSESAPAYFPSRNMCRRVANVVGLDKKAGGDCEKEFKRLQGAIVRCVVLRVPPMRFNNTEK
jgi:hypothetical protein